MSTRELRETIKKHGLRELCSDPADQGLFTHLQAADGTEYQLVEGMNDRELWLAAKAGNHLFVFHTDYSTEEQSPVYITAKVIAFHHGDLHHGSKRQGDDNESWVQTQNQKYWLLAKS